MSKRAIFLGSFNPPHKGHYDVINSVIESGIMKSANIEKIHIIPCWQNPNKNKFTVPFVKRYQMVYFMFGPLIRKGLVCPDDIEDQLEPHPEYTCQLISWFKSGNDECINKNKEGFWWIITTETLDELIEGKWKLSSELLYDNNFIVVHKKDEDMSKYYEMVRTNKLAAFFVELKSNANYHSTQLREKVKNGESIEEETCFWVNDYIKDMNLYKD